MIVSDVSFDSILSAIQRLPSSLTSSCFQIVSNRFYDLKTENFTSLLPWNRFEFTQSFFIKFPRSRLMRKKFLFRKVKSFLFTCSRISAIRRKNNAIIKWEIFSECLKRNLFKFYGLVINLKHFLHIFRMIRMIL